jgi:non-ribosomal peptide synthetase component F
VLINSPTIADLLVQLQNLHNQTLDHEHLALAEIQRVTGHHRLFDTVFVYENYPTDPNALVGADGLAITELANRDYYHYPLTIQAVPGRELDLRIQYRVDVFDAVAIEALTERFRQVLAAMIDDPNRPMATPPALGLPERQDRASTNGQVDAVSDDSGYRAPVNLVEQILAAIYAQVLGVDVVIVDESFFDLGGDSLSAMQAIAAINTALGTRLTVTALITAPSVRSLSRQLASPGSSVDEIPAVSPAGGT